MRWERQSTWVKGSRPETVHGAKLEEPQRKKKQGDARDVRVFGEEKCRVEVVLFLGCG